MPFVVFQPEDGALPSRNHGLRRCETLSAANEARSAAR